MTDRRLYPKGVFVALRDTSLRLIKTDTHRVHEFIWEWRHWSNTALKRGKGTQSEVSIRALPSWEAFMNRRRTQPMDFWKREWCFEKFWAGVTRFGGKINLWSLISTDLSLPLFVLHPAAVLEWTIARKEPCGKKQINKSSVFQHSVYTHTHMFKHVHLQVICSLKGLGTKCHAIIPLWLFCLKVYKNNCMES